MTRDKNCLYELLFNNDVSKRLFSNMTFHNNTSAEDMVLYIEINTTVINTFFWLFFSFICEEIIKHIKSFRN